MSWSLSDPSLFRSSKGPVRSPNNSRKDLPGGIEQTTEIWFPAMKGSTSRVLSLVLIFPETGLMRIASLSSLTFELDAVVRTARPGAARAPAEADSQTAGVTQRAIAWRLREGGFGASTGA
jgi:hypothetical protein